MLLTSFNCVACIVLLACGVMLQNVALINSSILFVIDLCMSLFAGKVYNITPYMKFHPGGREELMKGAGIDCTIIFEEV